MKDQKKNLGVNLVNMDLQSIVQSLHQKEIQILKSVKVEVPIKKGIPKLNQEAMNKGMNLLIKSILQNMN